MARWVAVHDRRTGTYLELHDGPEDETPRTRERGVLTSRNANLKKTIGAEVAPDLSHLESASLELQPSEDMPFDDCGRLRGHPQYGLPSRTGWTPRDETEVVEVLFSHTVRPRPRYLSALSVSHRKIAFV